MSSSGSPIQLVKRFLQKRRWAEATKLSDSERLVLSLFLESNDPRLRKFWLQWESAERFERRFTAPQEHCYELKWMRSEAVLSHNSLQTQQETEPVVVIDQLTRKQLQFRLTIQPGGWAGPLTGETVDGSPFPLDWKPELPKNRRDATQLSLLPPQADQCAGKKRMEAWLEGEHIDPGFTDFIEFFEPATDVDLKQLEQRLQIELPETYRQFLQCSNGLLIGENYFPGSSDARLAPFPDDSFPPALFLTDEIFNNLGDGFYCLPLEGEAQLQIVHFDQYGERKTISDSLPEFLHLKLETLPNQYLNYCDLLRLEI